MAKVNSNKDWLSSLKVMATNVTAIGVIGGIGFGVGCWKSHIEQQNEINAINQAHNNEIVNLKIEFNNRLIERQNCQDREIVELKNELNLANYSKKK